MAGNWIKVEKCSPNKPEVMRLARLWDIPQDQAFGIVFRFWSWIDDACVDGLVDGVASHEVDAMMNYSGFAKSLETVGWLEIDDARPCIRIPNFDKHNSESAKNRALKADRQARWRFNSVDGRPSPDKIRLDKKEVQERWSPLAPGTPKPVLQDKVNGNTHPNGTSRASRLPADWVLPEVWKDWSIAAHHLDPQKVVRISIDFRDYWIAKPGKDGCKLDWQATWRRWVRQECGGA